MIRFNTASIGAAILAVFLLGACQGPELWELNLDAEYDKAVAWINANSPAPRYASKRPTVFTTSQGEMQRVAKAGPGRRIAAAYFGNIHAIAFAVDFDPSSVKDRGVAIHEIDHALNRFTVYPCKRAREAESYRLQALYYRQNGTSLQRETGLTPEAVKSLTTCP